MLVKYTRDKNGHRNGVVVAVDHGVVGWSKCNKKDKFNKELGLRIAEGRAMVGSTVGPPREIAADLEHMRKRSQKYYGIQL